MSNDKSPNTGAPDMGGSGPQYQDAWQQSNGQAGSPFQGGYSAQSDIPPFPSGFHSQPMGGPHFHPFMAGPASPLPPGYLNGAGYGPPPGYAPYGAPGYAPPQGPEGSGSAQPDMNNFIKEIANGGNPLSSLTKMLDFSDGDFWKGAAVGAALVLLMTNEDLKNSLLGMFSGSKENGEAEQSGKEE